MAKKDDKNSLLEELYGHNSVQEPEREEQCQKTDADISFEDFCERNSSFLMLVRIVRLLAWPLFFCCCCWVVHYFFCETNLGILSLISVLVLFLLFDAIVEGLGSKVRKRILEQCFRKIRNVNNRLFRGNYIDSRKISEYWDGPISYLSKNSIKYCDFDGKLVYFDEFEVVKAMRGHYTIFLGKEFTLYHSLGTKGCVNVVCGNFPNVDLPLRVGKSDSLTPAFLGKYKVEVSSDDVLSKWGISEIENIVDELRDNLVNNLGVSDFIFSITEKNVTLMFPFAGNPYYKFYKRVRYDYEWMKNDMEIASILSKIEVKEIADAPADASFAPYHKPEAEPSAPEEKTQPNPDESEDKGISGWIAPILYNAFIIALIVFIIYCIRSCR